MRCTRAIPRHCESGESASVQYPGAFTGVASHMEVRWGGVDIMAIGVVEGHWEHTLIETTNTAIGSSAYSPCQGAPKADRAYHDVGL